MKFNENPSSGSRVFSLWTDRHDNANSRFSQFDESAKNVGHLDRNVLCFKKNDMWTVLIISSFTQNFGSLFPAVNSVKCDFRKMQTEVLEDIIVNVI
jgi:hypothetical protein